MEFPKGSLKNNLSNKNNNMLPPMSVSSERNFYLSPEYSTGIFEQNNLKTYQNPLPPRQNYVVPNYYLQNEVGFSQNFSGSETNCFDIVRESAGLQRLEYREENDTNFDEAFNTAINTQQEKEKQKASLVSKSTSIELVLFNCKL